MRIISVFNPVKVFHILQQLFWKNSIVMKFNKWLVVLEDMEVFQVKQAPLADIFMDSVFLLDGLQWLFILSQVNIHHSICSNISDWSLMI